VFASLGGEHALVSAVPLQLGGFSNENPLVKAHRGKSQPHSLRVRWSSHDTLCPDNGGNSGSGYFPAWQEFALQLRGPFGNAVRAGSHLTLLSGTPWRCLLALFIVFRYFVLPDYIGFRCFVNS